MANVDPTDGPPSLLEAACKSMVENAKQQKLELDFEKFPPILGKEIWKHCQLMDIITLAAHTNQPGWFSQNVIERPRGFTVEVEKSQFCDGICFISITCNHKFTLKWAFAPREAIKHPAAYMLKIRNQLFSTIFVDKIGSDTVIVRSHYSGELNLRDLIDWLCDLFESDVGILRLHKNAVTTFDEYIGWSQLESADYLRLAECESSEFLHSVLPGRHERNLKTQLSGCKFMAPLGISSECQKNVAHRCTDFNLTHFDMDRLIEFINALGREIQITASLPDFEARNLEYFKLKSGLSDCEKTLNATHCPDYFADRYPPTQKYKLFYLVRGFSLVIRFFEKEEGVYNSLRIHTRESKDPEEPNEYEGPEELDEEYRWDEEDDLDELGGSERSEELDD